MRFDYNSLLCKVHGLHKNMPWLTAQLPRPAVRSLTYSRGLVGTRHPARPPQHPRLHFSRGWYVPGAGQPWLTGTTPRLTARSRRCSRWALCRCARTSGAGQNLQDKDSSLPSPFGAAVEAGIPAAWFLEGCLPLCALSPSLLRTRELSSPGRVLSSPPAPAPTSLGEAVEKERGESQDI